jgi:hypothetical protein
MMAACQTVSSSCYSLESVFAFGDVFAFDRRNLFSVSNRAGGSSMVESDKDNANGCWFVFFKRCLELYA